MDDSRFVKGNVDVGLEGGSDLLGQGNPAVESLFDRLEQKVGRFFIEVDEERFFIGEIKVKCADGDVGIFHNIPNGGGVIAFLGEYPNGRLH